MHSRSNTSSRLAVAAALGITLSGFLFAQNDKRFFIGPTTISGLDAYKELFRPGADWDWVQQQGSVFEFHNNSLIPDPSDPAYLENSVLIDAATMLRNTSLKTGVIAGGLRPSGGGTDPGSWLEVGEKTAKREFAGFSRWTELGGTIDVLMLDSPFSKMATYANMPWTVAAGELADYLDRFKQKFPGAEVGFMEPIPRYTVGSYKTFNQIKFGDFKLLLNTVLPILEARGHELSFFLADSPFTYNEGTPNGWDKLVAVQDHVRSKGLRFGLFINDDLPAGKTDEQYFLNSLEVLNRFRAAGGDPDDFNFRSWYEYPSVAVPESQPHSFTWNTRRMMERVFGTYVAPNDHNVTVAFRDSSLGGLRLEKGEYDVDHQRLAIHSNSEFALPGVQYDSPTIIFGGDMLDMAPGSEVSVILTPHTGVWNYRVVMVDDPGVMGHVEVRATHKTLDQQETLAVGPQFFLFTPKLRYHLAMRIANGVLAVTVNKTSALNILNPLPDRPRSTIGLAFTNPEPFSAKINLDYLDVRESNATTSVSVDAENHVVFSIIKPKLLTTFRKEYFLNAFSGFVLSFNQFAQAVLPSMTILKSAGDYILLRSNSPIGEGTIVSLVYEGDFETVIVE